MMKAPLKTWGFAVVTLSICLLYFMHKLEDLGIAKITRKYFILYDEKLKDKKVRDDVRKAFIETFSRLPNN